MLSEHYPLSTESLHLPSNLHIDRRTAVMWMGRQQTWTRYSMRGDLWWWNEINNPNNNMAGDSETNTQAKSQGATLERQDTILAFGKLKLRGQTDELPQYVIYSLLNVCRAVDWYIFQRLVVCFDCYPSPCGNNWTTCQCLVNSGSSIAMEGRSAKQWSTARGCWCPRETYPGSTLVNSAKGWRVLSDKDLGRLCSMHSHLLAALLAISICYWTSRGEFDIS